MENNTDSKKGLLTRFKDFLLRIFWAIMKLLFGFFWKFDQDDSQSSSDDTVVGGYSNKNSSRSNEKLTSEQIIELSWKFLTDITEKVILLSKAVNDKILMYGKILNDKGVAYIHVIETERHLPTSPAKAAASKEQSADEQSR